MLDLVNKSKLLSDSLVITYSSFKKSQDEKVINVHHGLTMPSEFKVVIPSNVSYNVVH